MDASQLERELRRRLRLASSSGEDSNAKRGDGEPTSWGGASRGNMTVGNPLLGMSENPMGGISSSSAAGAAAAAAALMVDKREGANKSPSGGGGKGESGSPLSLTWEADVMKLFALALTFVWESLGNVEMSWDQLKDGIALCNVLTTRLIPRFQWEHRRPRLPVCQTSYPAIAKTVVEKKNLEEFITSAVDLFPHALKNVGLRAEDLYDDDDVPKFAAFLVIMAEEAGMLVREEATDAFSLLGHPAVLEKIHVSDARRTQAALALLPTSVAALLAGSKEVPTTESHVRAFLAPLGLEQLTQVFVEQGFDTLGAILEITQDDLLVGMGITRRGDVRKILAARRDLARTVQSTKLIRPLDSTRSLSPSSALQASWERASELCVQHAIHPGDSPNEKMAFEASFVAEQLTRVVFGFERALVVDLDGAVAFVGLAGDLAPSARVALHAGDDARACLQRALRSGVLPPHEFQRRPLFLVAPPTRALADIAFDTFPRLFMCGSEAALTLAAAGLVDGIVLDVDAEGVGVAIAVAGGVTLSATRASCRVSARPHRWGEGEDDAEAPITPPRVVVGATPNAATSPNEDEEDPRSDALCGLVLRSLSQCGNPGTPTHMAVKSGGLVLSSRTRGVQVSSLAKTFAAGTFLLDSNARWCAASRIAATPDFALRWATKSTLTSDALREQLFPLVPHDRRVELARAALHVAEFVCREFSLRGAEGVKLELQTALERMDAINALNEQVDGFVSFTASSSGDNAVGASAAARTTAVLGTTTAPTSTTTTAQSTPFRAGLSPPITAFNENSPAETNRLQREIERILGLVRPLLPSDALNDVRNHLINCVARADFSVLRATTPEQVLEHLPVDIRDRTVAMGATRFEDGTFGV